MKKIRKTVATALSLLCLVAALSPAYAVGTAEDTPQGVIEPRYTGLSQLWASLSPSIRMEQPPVSGKLSFAPAIPATSPWSSRRAPMGRTGPKWRRGTSPERAACS